MERVNGMAENLVDSSSKTAESINLMRDVAENVERSLRQILEN